MSVKPVHVIDRSPSGAVCRNKIKTLEFQTSIQDAKKKTDADRADDKHGRFIRIKAEKVTHSAVDISEREHRVQIMRIPAVGEEVLERVGFTEQVPEFLQILRSFSTRQKYADCALPLSPSKRMVLLNNLPCRIHTGKENTYFTIPILYQFLMVELHTVSTSHDV